MATHPACARCAVTCRRCGQGVYRSSRASERGSALSLLVAEVEPGRLVLGVAVERVEALVPSEARLLVATEGHGDVRRVEGVDEDDAGPDPARKAMSTVDVARPESRGKAVRRVVGDCQRLV